MTDPQHDRWLDAAMSALPEVTVPADLRRRIAELPITHPRPARVPWLSPTFASIWWSLCGALGIVCGLYLETPEQADHTAQADMIVASVETEESAQEELLTAAFASDLSVAWSDTWEDATLGEMEDTP